MNNLAFTFLNRTPVEFSPSLIVSVESITRFDMVYIYHHISIGQKVRLEETLIEGKYEVFFKTYKLGYIQLKKWIISKENLPMEAKIRYIQKHKFLPINQLDIEISGLDLATF